MQIQQPLEQMKTLLTVKYHNMQKLKNIETNEAYIITGSIAVPRATEEEDVFEIWIHYSVDVDGNDKIETIEVPPTNSKWQVIE